MIAESRFCFYLHSLSQTNIVAAFKIVLRFFNGTKNMEILLIRDAGNQPSLQSDSDLKKTHSTNRSSGSDNSNKNGNKIMHTSSTLQKCPTPKLN